MLHSQPGGLTRVVVTNPGYPDPSASAVFAAQTPSVVRLAPDVQIPQTVQYSAGLDHQLQKTTTLSLTYTGARVDHLFRSRDINAPLPPLYLARPDPAYGVIRQAESTGHQASDSLAVTLRGRVSAVKVVDLGVGVTLNSGGPFTETLGGDVYNNAADARGRPALDATRSTATASRRSICARRGM